MKSIPFEGCDLVIGESQEEYQNLHAKIVNIPIEEEGARVCPGVTFCFRLTEEEIAEIVKTGVIWHTVMTFGNPLQPQHMSTSKPEFA